jgi:hypothetical protein
VGHTMKWIRRRMIDRAKKNRSITKSEPEETQQRLVVVGIAAQRHGGETLARQREKWSVDES